MFVIRIANRFVMVVDLEGVQLHDKHTVRLESFVLGAAMRTPTTEQALIPSATGFHVGHCDKGLRSHSYLLLRAKPTAQSTTRIHISDRLLYHGQRPYNGVTVNLVRCIAGRMNDGQDTRQRFGLVSSKDLQNSSVLTSDCEQARR